jgi:hypothetical protein
LQSRGVYISTVVLTGMIGWPAEATTIERCRDVLPP